MKRRSASGLPRSVIAVAVVGVALLLIPLVGLLVQAPWGRLFSLLGNDETITAIRVSAVVSVAAAALSILVGVPLAFVLARVNFRGKSLLL